MASQFDYRGWVEQAKAFTEKCRRLPGTVKVVADVAPPMSESDVESLARSLPRGMPDSIRGFLTKGSADCHCHYSWEPMPERDMEMPFDSKLRKLVPFYSVFPDRTYIYGGADLCCATNKGEKRLTSGIMTIQRSGLKHMHMGCTTIGKIHPKPRELFAFAAIGNGDYLTLEMSSSTGCNPVVYLDHEGPYESPPLAPSFEDFLDQWEKLSYIGPDLFHTFRNPKNDFIDGRCDKAAKLRKIFERALA